MQTANDILLLENHLDFWEHLTDSQQEYLISNTKSAHYSAGEFLHYADSDCLGLLLIKSGQIRTFLLSEEGREITLYRLEQGDICILSASCILHSISFEVSITAETDCEILQISSFAFAKISSENIYAECFSYKLAADRFSDVMWAMQELLFTSFDKRLAAFLLDESEKQHSNTVSMTHQQIAGHLGSAREVVSRMLKYFSTEGYISLSRGHITILDRDRLKSIL